MTIEKIPRVQHFLKKIPSVWTSLACTQQIKQHILLNGDITLSDYLYGQAANIEYYEFPDIDEANLEAENAAIVASLPGTSLDAASFETTSQYTEAFVFESTSPTSPTSQLRYADQNMSTNSASSACIQIEQSPLEEYPSLSQMVADIDKSIENAAAEALKQNQYNNQSIQL